MQDQNSATDAPYKPLDCRTQAFLEHVPHRSTILLFPLSLSLAQSPSCRISSNDSGPTIYLTPEQMRDSVPCSISTTCPVFRFREDEC